MVVQCEAIRVQSWWPKPPCGGFTKSQSEVCFGCYDGDLRCARFIPVSFWRLKNYFLVEGARCAPSGSGGQKNPCGSTKYSRPCSALSCGIDEGGLILEAQTERQVHLSGRRNAVMTAV
jgi:hypothetical protein